MEFQSERSARFYISFSVHESYRILFHLFRIPWFLVIGDRTRSSDLSECRMGFPYIGPFLQMKVVFMKVATNSNDIPDLFVREPDILSVFGFFRIQKN